jgi:hypothetical protein
MGALSNKAAIATEYFNICVSYAESTPQGRKEKQPNISYVPSNRRKLRELEPQAPTLIRSA